MGSPPLERHGTNSARNDTALLEPPTERDRLRCYHLRRPDDRLRGVVQRGGIKRRYSTKCSGQSSVSASIDESLQARFQSSIDKTGHDQQTNAKKKETVLFSGPIRLNQSYIFRPQKNPTTKPLLSNTKSAPWGPERPRSKFYFHYAAGPLLQVVLGCGLNGCLNWVPSTCPGRDYYIFSRGYL